VSTSTAPSRFRVAAALVAAAAASAVVAGVTPIVSPVQAADPCPWMDKRKSAESRARELVAAMTLNQKLAQLAGRGYGKHYGAADVVPGIPELCLPDVVFNDAGAGVGDGQTGTTAFPSSIAQAASWDPALQRQVGAAIAREARQKGINVLLAPGVNMARNPLSGRNFEYAGEDPFLAGRTGAAIIQGVQSEHVAATVKHYVLNEQEFDRMWNSSHADERTLRELYLPPFEDAVNAGVASVMCSYNRVDATYACEHPYLLNDVLKRQLGFPGWVMSDWGSTHSSAESANAGMDEEHSMTQADYFSADKMRPLVESGKVSKKRIDDMVLRKLRMLFRVGVFDHPAAAQPAAAAANVSTAEQQLLARKAAEAGTVLLRNTGSLLPLKAKGKTIAVIGRPAGPVGAQYAYHGGGSSKVPVAGNNPNVVTPLDGIRARAEAEGNTVKYADGSDAATAAATAQGADVAIVFAAGGSSEGVDRTSLSLDDASCTVPSLIGAPCVNPPGARPDELISAVAAANRNTVVVLQTGGPVTMPWLNQVPSVLATWYPGQEDGNAVASVLFGDVNPSGKLPFSFPKSMKDTWLRSAEQYPGVEKSGDEVGKHSTYSEGLLIGYRWFDAKGLPTLFPFGYGLSYTTFAYSGLKVRSIASGATATFTVTNTGRAAGAEVAQLYVSMPPAAGEPPKQLKGYQKVALQPGKSAQVTIDLDRRAFAHWSNSAGGWEVAPGTYTIRVGGSSAKLPLSQTIQK
jgi:beta-glucosidase